MKMIIAVAVVGIVCLGGGYVLGSNMAGDKTQTISIAGSSSVGPLMTTFVQEYGSYNDAVSFNLSISDSTDGINKAMNGTVEIGMSSSVINADILAAGGVSTKICNDAIVIIVSNALYNGGAGVSNLTPAQIAGIYTGTITNWKDVGGPDAAITSNQLFIREAGSGTRDAFEKLITSTSGMPLNDSTQIADSTQNSTGAMRAAVSGSSGYAIGYISLGSKTSSDNVVTVNGVTPSVTTSQDGSYLLVRGFFLLTKGDPTGAVALFISWILSPTGQAILEKSGFVPLV